MKRVISILSMALVLMSMSECEKQNKTSITSFTVDGTEYYSDPYAWDNNILKSSRTYAFKIYEYNASPAFQFNCVGHSLKSDNGHQIIFGMDLHFPGTLKLEKTYRLSESIGNENHMYIRNDEPGGEIEGLKEWSAEDAWIRFTQCDRKTSGRYEISAEFEFMAVDDACCDTIYVTEGKIYAPMKEFY